MATRVGTGAIGDTSVTKSVTAGNLLVAHIKWEGGATLTGGAWGSGNTWTIASQTNHSTGSEPGSAIAYVLSAASTASITVTPIFSGSPSYQRIELEEFNSSAGSWDVDGSAITGQGSGGGGSGSYSCSSPASSITTTAAGVVFAGVAEYAALGTVTAGGSPAFTQGAPGSGTPNGESFCVFLLSGSAQTVTPGASINSGYTRWVMSAQAFKESSGGSTTIPPGILVPRQLGFRAGR